MTELQKRVVDKLTEFAGLSPDQPEQWVSVTRAECMELLGLIDRLRVKAEGGRPLGRTTRPSAASVAFEEAGWMPPATLPFDGTYPPADPEKRAGAKEPPPAGSGDPT